MHVLECVSVCVHIFVDVCVASLQSSSWCDSKVDFPIVVLVQILVCQQEEVSSSSKHLPVPVV